MNSKIMKTPGWLAALMTVLLLICPTAALAVIDGVTSATGTFNLTAGTTHILTPDANSILVWGYKNDAGTIGPQYPGPTLIVTQGDAVTVTLTNDLDEPVSIVFPGQKVTATGGIPGLVTREALPGGTVTYTFTAANPGTYLYHSGSHQDLQVEMGLFGALIVRPAGFVGTGTTTGDPNRKAYGHADTAYDREFLFLLSEMDPVIHEEVEFGRKNRVDTTAIHLVNWFINGRAAPDTMAAPNVPFLLSQPYNCSPIAKPGERVLLRMLGGNKDLHPFHTHGNNFRLIAKDGTLLESAAGLGPDIAVSNFTQRVVPGETYDAIFTWTGANLGWDFTGGLDLTGTCGQTAGMDPVNNCNRFPVAFPDVRELTNGPFWSGSPFLGVQGSLPPGQGTGNIGGGYFFMWHSHNERELTNNDIFPGGLLTMMMVVHPNADLTMMGEIVP